MAMSWPRGVYLEASVLCVLPMGIMNAEIERLKGLSAVLGTPISIPEVSFQEWICARKGRIRKDISDVDRGISNLSSLFDYVSRIQWKKDKETIVADAEIFTKKILADNGISIINTPNNIDLGKLVRMSVNKIRPFEERHEKGFRDSINLFTVLEHAKNQKKGSHIVVARDKVYQHEEVTQLAKEYHVELIVLSSIYDAILTLEEFIKHVNKTFETYENLVLKKFLLDNSGKISEYMKRIEFPLPFLNKNYELGVNPQIVNIEDIQVVDIDSVTRGVLPKDFSKLDKGRVNIFFVVKTKLNIRVEEVAPIPERRFKYGEKVFSQEAYWLSRLLAAQDKRTVNKPIRRAISVEGSVMLEREKNQKGSLVDKYSDLHIDSVIIE